MALATAADDPFVGRFRDLARSLNMAIGLTYLERGPGRPSNTLALIDRSGEVVLTYRKVHLCDFDAPEVACAAGDAFPVASLQTASGPVQVGAMICMDREYPESARLLMLHGAEIILTPNACKLATCPVFGDARLAQFRARAFENLAGVAMANYPAPHCDGHSVAFDADGSSIVEAPEGEGIWCADFDLARIRTLRREEWFRIRPGRPDCYRQLGPSEARGIPPVTAGRHDSDRSLA